MKRSVDNIVLIDVDNDAFPNVIIIDVPESVEKKLRGSRMHRKSSKFSLGGNIISLEDNGNSDNDNNENTREGDNMDVGASTSRGGSSSFNHFRKCMKNSPGVECQFLYERKAPQNLSLTGRIYSAKHYNQNRYGLSSDSDTSESDWSDCEMTVREQWENAFLRRNHDLNDQSNASSSDTSFHEVLEDKNSYEGVPEGSNSANYEQNFPSPAGADDFFVSSVHPAMEYTHEFLARRSSVDKNESPNLEGNNSVKGKITIFGVELHDTVHCPDGDTMHSDPNCIINERERLKETDEFKRAVEEEWASRQQQLQIQAEEAQRLRRLQKRRKAEITRAMDMEERQKHRVQEMRDLQKKDEEDMNMKDNFRAEIRNELMKLEHNCSDLCSLLRCLGVQVNGGLYPSSDEVHTAYKRALLKLHPDRTTRSDIRHQVEAEEKFKLLCRMKQNYLLASKK